MIEIEYRRKLPHATTTITGQRGANINEITFVHSQIQLIAQIKY